jgi:hypothetical protein
MKLLIRRKYLILILSALICVVVGMYIGQSMIQNNFSTRLKLYSIFPQFAKYYENISIGDDSMAVIKQKDNLAYEIFSKSFSSPIQTRVITNTSGKSLRRSWKIDGGYLELTTGRGQEGYHIGIYFSKVLKTNWGNRAQVSDLKTVNEGFFNGD